LEEPATQATDVSFERTGTKQPLQDGGGQVSDKESQPAGSPRKRARVQSPPARTCEVVDIIPTSEAQSKKPRKRRRGGTI
jgi:hypothetical protein